MLHFSRLIPILSILSLSIADDGFYRTLLYGEKLKGFIKVNELKNDNYVVSFDIQFSQNDDVKWALHMSSAPYDMTIMTDNCKRVKKSPHLMRSLPLNETIVPGNILHGHTIVLSSQMEVLACATIILPKKPILSASFHADIFEGHIHVVRMLDNQARLLPDLRYLMTLDDSTLYKQTIVWAFVENCSESNTDSLTDGSEIGIDSRTTITTEVPNNYSLYNLALYADSKVIACVPLEDVEPRTVMSVNLTLIQRNPFEPVYSESEFHPNILHIRDDCLDLSTESIHNAFDNYYPSVTIFGSESIILKSLYAEDLCSVLRPHFPRPASTTYLMHPVNGRITLLDTEDEILVTGELRHSLESSSSRATIQFSSQLIRADACTDDVVCVECKEITDVAVIVGKNEKMVSLSGVMSWFDIRTIRSAIIDLQWTKICSNFTYLPNGSISAHALIKSLSTTTSKTVASIVAMEYPANNYTEVIVNKRQTFDSAYARTRPIDMSITSGHPCGEQNIGPIKSVFWAPRLAQILSSTSNDTSVFIWFNMITGPMSVLGTSILLSDENKIFCGDFKPLAENTVAMVTFNSLFHGYIKMTQYFTSNWAFGMPTEAYYMLNTTGKKNRQLTSKHSQEEIIWDIVKDDFKSCDTATIFNPFEVEDACNIETIDFCPLGNATAKSRLLQTGSQYHILVKDLPLSGPYSVIGKYLRLRSSKNISMVECQPIYLISETTFRWQVSQKINLREAQLAFASAVNVPEYQVEVDYTRKTLQGNCVIYNIKLLADDGLTAQVQESFDVEQNHFIKGRPEECNMGMTRCYCERIIVVSLLFFLSVVQNDQTVENNMCSGAEITYEATNAIQKLTTPNYNFGFLPNNSTCSIIIRAPENSSVWIKIEQLSMEPQLFDQCSDFIKIINTSSKTPQKEDTLAVLCGAVNNRQFVSTTNVLRLDILSDMLIESKGAEISYRALENKKCEDGWHEFKMKCFFLSEENKELSWVEAQRACVEQQSNLASISQYTVYEETLNWLTEVNASKTLWIGMHDAVQEGVFVSMSGNHDFPFNWGSPNSLHNSDVKDCLYLDSPLHNRTDGDMFRLDDCRKKRAFLCEKSKDGKTWTAPDQEDIVRNGAQSWSLDLAFWLLFALILLLIALMCIACGYAITQKQRQARVSALEGQGNQAPANTMSTTPSDQRAVRHQPERSDTIQETVTEVQDLIEVHSNDHKIKTEEILDKNMRNVESEKHPLEIKSTGNDSFPLHQESPNQIIYIRGKEIAGNYQAGTNSRERTSNTFNTRDESFLKSKKAAELFGRPKMNVLDNVSAISLDEFWSNKPM